MTTSTPEERDYFTDRSVLLNPYQYFEEMRARGPVCELRNQDILMVTGFEECVEVLRNHRDFSSVIAPAGANVPLPFEPKEGDITDQIEAHRSEFPGGELVVSLDDKQHTALRSLVSRMFTPSRLKANQEFMEAYADELAREVAARGECELISEIATPFVTLVIADLLGVPAKDRELFREAIDQGPDAGSIENPDQPTDNSTLEYLGGFFAGYLQDRMATPGEDLLSELATATYPDGSKPRLEDLVGLATFMFAAGQDTSAKLLGNSIRYIVDTPGLQQQVREDPDLIPGLIEEVLRLEGSTKATFRVARRDTRIGDVKVPAGKRVVVSLAGANRDPRRWENPEEFILDRPKIREHLAFGRGMHTCAGAPLARAEVRVMLERFFRHTAHIDISEAAHGKPGERRLDYEPSFIIRGLSSLHLDLKPA